MDDFIHGKPLFRFFFQFLFHFLVLLNKLVSLYEISSNLVMGFLVSVVEISFSPMGVVSVVFLFLGMRNCSYWFNKLPKKRKMKN